MMAAAVRRHPWRTIVVALLVCIALALVVFVYGGTQAGGVGVAIA